MGKSKLNPVTEKLVKINPDTHPLFVKLWQSEEFKRIRTTDMDGFKAANGITMLCIVDDPNVFKETFDMVVIGPEVKTLFQGMLADAGFTDPSCGRQIASSLSINRLPAVAVFCYGEYLGAVEGLKNWGEYETELVKILTRVSEPPKKTISIRSS